jgi:anti-sigma28 factor (negative regulator of flagellin synthesis)
MRESIVFYRSFYEAIKELSAEEFRNAVMAIMEYGLNDSEIDTSGVAKAILIMAKPQIDKNNKRYENGLRGGTKPKQNQNETKLEPNSNQSGTKAEPKRTKPEPNDNVNDNDNVIKESEEKKPRFYPPTLEELKKYIDDNKYNVDPERFIDYYTANGWTVGKNRMKDWKAAVRNWDRSQKSGGRMRQESTAKTKFSNFEQRSYDYDALESALGGTNEQTE